MFLSGLESRPVWLPPGGDVHTLAPYGLLHDLVSTVKANFETIAEEARPDQHGEARVRSDYDAQRVLEPMPLALQGAP